MTAPSRLITYQGLPRTSQMLSALFEQLLSAATLAVQFRGSGEPAFFEAFMPQIAFLSSTLDILEQARMPGELGPLPLVRNRRLWSHPEIVSGYSPKLQVTASEAFASYVSAWNFSIEHDFGTRLARAALGFGAIGKNWSDVFQFLLDAFDRGYIVKSSDWASAVDLLSELYVRAPAESLAAVDFSTDELADETQAKFRELIDRPIQPEQVDKLLGWFLADAFSSIDTARAARNADEWILAKARVYGRVCCLHLLQGSFQDRFRLLPTLGAQLAQLEEIRADLGGEMRSARFRADDDKRIPVSFTSFEVVSREYARLLGPDSFEKVCNDRLVVPDALRELAHAGSLRNVTLPEEWQCFSPAVGVGMAMMLECDPSMVRSEPFAASHIDARCASLGYSPDQPSLVREIGVLAGKIDPEASKDQREFSGEARKKAIQSLIVDEAEQFLKDMTDAQEGRIKWDNSHMPELSRLYPWNGLFLWELGIHIDEAGRSEEAYTTVSNAILCLPRQAGFWDSLAVITAHLERSRDVVVFDAISKGLDETGENQ